ncbi:hypothetical protein IFM12275_49400 [Nocardia sputorum]|nr:hypothetical protein IFM12275_49400 [Nocardia sputorum]
MFLSGRSVLGKFVERATYPRWTGNAAPKVEVTSRRPAHEIDTRPVESRVTGSRSVGQPGARPIPVLAAGVRHGGRLRAPGVAEPAWAARAAVHRLSPGRAAARRGISARGERRAWRSNDTYSGITCMNDIFRLPAVAGSTLPGVFSGGGATGPEVVVEIIRLA